MGIQPVLDELAARPDQAPIPPWGQVVTRAPKACGARYSPGSHARSTASRAGIPAPHRHAILNTDRPTALLTAFAPEGPLTPSQAMDLALALSRHAIGLSDPNPRVGCVITDPQGRLLGAGHTQQAGGPHAEVMALRDARARGHGEAALAGSHVYVTLEPCAHHGRTPPCCEALSAARVGRVHIALADPNPLVAGKGRAHLEAAGIPCETGLGAAEAREINIGFLSRMVRGRPFVRMKIAASLDGRTALPDGTSQWITGPAARQDGQTWRQRAGALLTGIGTVLDDDPRLDLRLPGPSHPPLQPLRVIADSRLQTPPGARILQPPGRALLVHAEAVTGKTWPQEVETLSLAAGPQVDLAALLDELGRRGINELHVEAGATLNGALLKAGLVDELLIYLAPALLGDGRGMAALGTLPGLDAAPRFQWLETTPVEGDLRLRLRRADLGF